MTSVMVKTLCNLEWHRLKGVVVLLSAGYTLFAVISGLYSYGQAPFVEMIYEMLFIALPFLAGLVLSAGMISGDAAENIQPLILSQPVSRSSLWLTRMVFRLMLFLLVMLLWLSLNQLFPLKAYPAPLSKLFLTGILMFCIGLIVTNITRSSFESAIIAGTSGIIIMTLLRDTWFATIVLIPVLAVAARDLFVSREPLEWQALMKRMACWFLGILIFILIMTFV